MQTLDLQRMSGMCFSRARLNFVMLFTFGFTELQVDNHWNLALVYEKWERSEGVQDVSREFTSLGTSVYNTKKRSRSLSGSFNFNERIVESNPHNAALVDEKWEIIEGVKEVFREFTSLGTHVHATSKLVLTWQ